MSKYLGWKSFEREITQRMKDTGFDAKRNWDSQFAKSDLIDVVAPPYGLQLKYGIKPDLVGAWKEASQNKDLIPVGIARWKGTRRTLVCIDLETFLRLIEK